MVSAGKQNILQTFQSHIRGENAGLLQGSKIILPDYYTLSTYDTPHLSNSDSRIDSLLRILVLHFDNATVLPHGVDEMYACFKKTLALNREYRISKATIRFQKNGDVHIRFRSPVEARDFINAYNPQPDNDQ